MDAVVNMESCVCTRRRKILLVLVVCSVLAGIFISRLIAGRRQYGEEENLPRCSAGYFRWSNRQQRNVHYLQYTFQQTKQKGKNLYTNSSAHYLQQLYPIQKFHRAFDSTSFEDVVFVTGSSSNHFDESIAAIASVQNLPTAHKIIYYDLGLTPEQISKLKKWCGVEYRLFDFKLYPPHVTTLMNYAWKILIISQVLKTHYGLVWFDSSIRFRATDLTDIYLHSLANGGFTMLSCIDRTVVSLTHPMMYSYLPTDRQRMRTATICQGGALLVLHTEEVFYDVLWPLYTCSLEKWCLAPNRDVYCDYRKLKKRTVYADCHRYDMSAMSILLLNKWHFDQSCFKAPRRVLTVERGSNSTGYHVNSCD